MTQQVSVGDVSRTVGAVLRTAPVMVTDVIMSMSYDPIPVRDCLEPIKFLEPSDARLRQVLCVRRGQELPVMSRGDRVSCATFVDEMEAAGMCFIGGFPLHTARHPRELGGRLWFSRSPATVRDTKGDRAQIMRRGFVERQVWRLLNEALWRIEAFGADGLLHVLLSEAFPVGDPQRVWPKRYLHWGENGRICTTSHDV